MVESMKRTVRRGLRLFGADVHRYRHTLPAVRARTLTELGIDLVLDVGANQGQYARQLRADGYPGRIVSFEPLPEAFAILSESLSSDRQWQGVHVALGDRDGSTKIHESANSWSSSILDASPSLVHAVPAAAQVASHTTDLARLDSIVESFLRADDRIYLKLDVQGYELAVLRGARQTLERITAVESELSLVRLYEGQALFYEVADHLGRAGFHAIWLEKGLIQPHTGHMLELDALFVQH